MKKISRRNFLLASGVVTIGAAPVSYTHLDVYKRQKAAFRIFNNSIL